LLLFLSMLITLHTNYAGSFNFEKINITSVIPSNNVTQIFQDKMGFIWFCTVNGLVRYDGKTFKIFKADKNNPNSLIDNYIIGAVVSSDGYIWIATLKGLNRYNPENNNFKRYIHDKNNPDSISNNKITAIELDKHDDIWLGTADNKLNQFNIKTEIFKKHILKNTLRKKGASHILHILIDKQDMIWFGTNRGLFSLDKTHTKCIYYPSRPKSTNNMHGIYIRKLYEANNGDIWIATIGAGISIYHKDTNTFTHLRSNYSQTTISSDNIKYITQDKFGLFWIATYGSGLNIYNPKTKYIQKLRYDPRYHTTINSPIINCIYKAQDDTMWIAYYHNGINNFNYKKQKFNFFTPAEYTNNPKDNSIIQSFIKINDKKTWMLTSNNIYCYHTSTKRITPAMNNRKLSHWLAKLHINHIYNTPQNIYFATRHNGLVIYNHQAGYISTYTKKDNETFKIIKHPTMKEIIIIISKKLIYTFNMTNHKTTIVVSPKQLDDKPIKKFKYNKRTESITIITSKNTYQYSIIGGEIKVNQKQITHLQQEQQFNTSNGEQWIINNLETKHIDSKGITVTYCYPRLWDKNTKYIIVEDHLHNIWFAHNRYVLKYDNIEKKMITYSAENGICNTPIKNILIDSHNNIWLIHTQGISQLNIKTKKFNIFNKKDGIQLNKYQRSIITQKDLIFISGENGLLIFDTRHINDSKYAHKTIITDIKLFDESIPVNKKKNGRIILKKTPSYCKHIILKYNERVITINFLSLNYDNSNNNYKYILKGFEKDWNYIKNFNSATYKKLSPGTYEFYVQGINQKNNSVEQMARLKITILQPYWMKWWFRIPILIGILLIYLLVYFIWNTKTRNENAKLEINNKQLNEQITKRKQVEKELTYYQQQLEEKVKERTEEIKILHKKLIDAARLAGRADITTGILHNAGNILNSINIDTNILEQILDKSKVDSIIKIADLLTKQKKQLVQYIQTNPKAEQLPSLLLKIGILTSQQNKDFKIKLQELKNNIDHITQIINTQLSHKSFTGYTEKITIDEIISDAIKILEPSIINHHIILINKKANLPPTPLDRHKVLQILINLLKNAKDSLKETTNNNKTITIEAYKSATKQMTITITDTGMGISKQKLNSIFNLGYTSKKDGHGFGLHSAANAAREMKGDLTVTSKGINKGATFILQLPFIEENLNSEPDRKKSEE